MLKGFVARAFRLYEQEPGEALASARLGLYVRRWVTWAGAGLIGPARLERVGCRKGGAITRGQGGSQEATHPGAGDR